MNLSYILDISLLLFGFGFVIFWHELGHFLAAKYVGVKVEQFAVGFGHAMVSFRQGLGIRFGSSQKEFAAKVASGATNVSETEYRLNWIPLGGYVKMLGQDDMDPNAQSPDPRAFNRKSIPARMLVVSAGVIMNVILAGILFMVLFLYGFTASAPVAGGVIPGSPAALAGIRVGDRIELFDGAIMHDFNKLVLATALSEEDGPTPIVVKKPDGKQEQYIVRAAKPEGKHGLLMIGVSPAVELRGGDPETAKGELQNLKPELFGKGLLAIMPGDTIVSANGVSFADPKDLSIDQKAGELRKFDDVVQKTGGKPITLVVRNAAGEQRTEEVPVSFESNFEGMYPEARSSLIVAGFTPRSVVDRVEAGSVAADHFKPGDVVLSIRLGDEIVNQPAHRTLTELVDEAGNTGRQLVFTVLRDGQEHMTGGIVPTVKLKTPNKSKRYVLGLGIGFDDTHATIAEVIDRSPAADAGIPSGSTLVSVGGQPVADWFDLCRQLAAAEPGKEFDVVTAARPEPYKLKLSKEQIDSVAGLRYGTSLALRELTIERMTRSPLIAMWWGVTETRDLILQFYLTLQRMIDGGISFKNVMGPVGIFDAGTKFAAKGTDWLIWFLAMISANLAVVNFLPIPIVDGGLFVFLILEKIMGRPLSPKMQGIAQYIGLALLLSVFLLATYQDIARLF